MRVSGHLVGGAASHGCGTAGSIVRSARRWLRFGPRQERGERERKERLGGDTDGAKLAALTGGGGSGSVACGSHGYGAKCTLMCSFLFFFCDTGEPREQCRVGADKKTSWASWPTNRVIRTHGGTGESVTAKSNRPLAEAVQLATLYARSVEIAPVPAIGVMHACMHVSMHGHSRQSSQARARRREGRTSKTKNTIEQDVRVVKQGLV
jgi:hypothetical protein